MNLFPDSYFRLQDLRRLERSLSVQIVVLTGMVESDGILAGVLLVMMPDGLSEEHRKDYLRSEIDRYIKLREMVRALINKF